MGVSLIVKKLNNIFSVSNNKKNKHYDGIQKLLNKLEIKEEKIKAKLTIEKNKLKRRKQRRSLSVIRAHRKKAQKLLNT